LKVSQPYSLENILAICYPVVSKSVFSGSRAAVFRGVLRMIPLLIPTLNSRGFTENPEGKPLLLPTQEGGFLYGWMTKSRKPARISSGGRNI
jgi:hypothetical protein